MQTILIILFSLLGIAVLYAGIRWAADTLQARRIVREYQAAEKEWQRELEKIEAEWDRKFDERYPSMCNDRYDEKAEE